MHQDYKLSPKAMEILEPLVRIELFQSSVYVQLANLANKAGFLKAEDYFLNESKEEREHAMIHYDYIVGRGSDFQMPKIEEPSEEGTTLCDITEVALKMEAEVSSMYQSAAAEMFTVCQMSYNHLLQFLKIQQDALKFYIDACSVLRDLDKGGELVAEKSVFKL